MSSTIEVESLTVFSGMPFIGNFVTYPHDSSHTKLTIYTELSVSRVREKGLVVLMGDQIDPSVNRSLNPNLKKVVLSCVVIARTPTEFSGHVNDLTAVIDETLHRVDLGGLSKFTIRAEPNDDRPTLFRLIGG